ncbi:MULTISPECIES: tetratricopeptide repeat protein [Myxococcaceae]|uniref:tetratricopeptide repeat protein n=1 Tax=Myxococcaceae TaxID=31 RepID=UPI00129D0DD5|nr:MULTISPECIES: tetratricopeptide repeat protein [Myxococcaceae]MBF5042089.1 tetratricopeptide repeat protein [Simulacricoccus sp. 17bor-14]
MVTFTKRRALGALALLSLAGCASSPSKTLVIPAEMRRQAAQPAAPTSPARPGAASAAAGAGAASGAGTAAAPAPGKYVIRMAEAGRVWEMELPEASGGYEVRVPLAGMGGPAEQLTAADEEMLSDALAQKGDKAEKSDKGDKAPVAKGDAKAAGSAPAALDARAAARKRSYLGGIAKVSEMYAARRYELGLIELVNLENDYPNDARLLSMKGSLYLKLGKTRLAREAWEKALTINPDNAGVAEALRSAALGEE